MALNIAYVYGSDDETGQAYGNLASSVAYTLTGSSASVGTPPAGAKVARLSAGEACYVSNNGSPASATNGIHIAAGAVADVQVSGPLYAITA